MATDRLVMATRRRLRHKALPILPHHAQANLEPEDVEPLCRLWAQCPSGSDSAEVGTLYGGSALLGAWYARERGARHWCLDQFGRPEATMIPGEPTMEIAWAHLRAEDLHRHAVLVPGDTVTAGPCFADACLGAVLIDADHTAEWAERDTAWALRVLCPGGLLAYHDALALPGDPPAYVGYQQTIRRLAEEHGLMEIERATGQGSVVVYRVGEERA